MRAFHWTDLPSLYQYRKHALMLDYEFLVTHGSPLGIAGVMQHLNPERESFTGVSYSSDGKETLIGNMCRLLGEKAVHLSFLMPVTACSTSALPPLIEGFAKEAGLWGAFHLLAEVNEKNMAFGCLKRAGFSVYAWQHVWKLKGTGDGAGSGSYWQPAQPSHEIAIQSLYHCLVPPLVQRAQQFYTKNSFGFVYYKDGDLLGFVEVKSGPRGVFLLPLIHPEVDHIDDVLTELIDVTRIKSGRPVYLAVRSYQAWLESALQDMGLESSPRQALMVRYLTQAQRVVLNPSPLAVIEGRKAETTTLLPNCTKDH